MPQSDRESLEQRGTRTLSRTSQTDHEPGLENISVGSMLGGGALLLYGLISHSGLSRLLVAGAGAGLIYRGLSQNGLLDGNLKRLALHTKATRPVEVSTSVTVDRPIDEVYSFWRRMENLPRFLKHIESIQDLGDGLSHWTAELPGGIEIEWKAEIVEDRNNELLVWKSVHGSDIYNEGFIAFHPAYGGSGTEVHARIVYRPPAGEVGSKIADFFSAIPSKLIKEDLRSFKQLLEAGEVPTIEGQSSARENRGNGRTDKLT